MALSAERKAALLALARRQALPPRMQSASALPVPHATTLTPTQIVDLLPDAEAALPHEALPVGVRPEFAFQPMEYRRSGGRGSAAQLDSIQLMHDKLRQSEMGRLPEYIHRYDPYRGMRTSDNSE